MWRSSSASFRTPVRSWATKHSTHSGGRARLKILILKTGRINGQYVPSLEIDFKVPQLFSKTIEEIFRYSE
jgi:hypothetical protein